VPYWSLSQWAKLKVQEPVNNIGAFEQTLAAEAGRHGGDGVDLRPHPLRRIRDEHGVRYMNAATGLEAAPRSPNMRTAI